MVHTIVQLRADNYLAAVVLTACHPHACCRVELQTVKNHAEFVARDVSKINFDPADSDATRLLKSLAVQFAFAGEYCGVCNSTTPWLIVCLLQ